MKKPTKPTKPNMNRRNFMKYSGVSIATLWGLGSLNLAQAATPYHVVVMGGGFAGATAAKYLKLWGGSSVNVTLVEPKTTYHTPILSNLILNNKISPRKLEMTYATLTNKYKVVHKTNKISAIDGVAKRITLDDNSTLSYDRLIVAPGVAFKYVNDYDISLVPHAWQGGFEVESLRRQIQNMPSNGTFVMTIPPAPFRCPPGPYERACVVADWLNKNKPDTKVIVLDANPDIIVEKDSFGSRFTRYGVEYRSNVSVTAVDSNTKTITVSGAPQASYTANVLNVIPAHKAGANALLTATGLLSGDWAPVHAQTFESTLVSGIHVIGDAQATGVPKAGHIANSEAKVCAEAVLNSLHGEAIAALPKINSACYSPVSETEATWLTGTFSYDAAQNKWVKITSSLAAGAPSTRSYREMFGWTSNLFSDTFS